MWSKFLILDNALGIPGPSGPVRKLGSSEVSPRDDPTPRQVGLRREFPETWLWNIYIVGYVNPNLWCWFLFVSLDLGNQSFCQFGPPWAFSDHFLFV